MYEKHFGLTDRPFSIAPDPRFLYMSRQHREALAHLLYGVGDAGGFVQLTGEVGTGKTTICRCFLEQMPGHVDVALILNSRVTALELLASLCDELRIPYPKDTVSSKTLIDVLNAHLLETHANGRRTVLIIDEAQNLSAEALEQVRLLTNLETSREKLLQIILIGQPELRELLAREDLRQLAQRITARYHLQPIANTDTRAYIRHRLQVCGAADSIFSNDAVLLVQKFSNGVPRLINVLCDRAMLGAFVEGKRGVDAEIVRKAAREVLPAEEADGPGARLWPLAAAALAAFALVIGGFVYFNPEHRWAVDSQLFPQMEPTAKVVAAVPAVQLDALRTPVEMSTTPIAAVEAPTDDELVDAVPPALASALASAGSRAAANAWAGLYRMWGLKSTAHTDEQACAQALSAGLRCLQGSGSWTALLHYDRPAVLLLVGTEGRRLPALLQEIDGTTVTLLVDDQRLQVPVDELKRHWFGEYRLLWRMPPHGNSALRPGDRNRDVQWLREALQSATGLRSIAPDPWYFDAGLRELLESFQSDSELDADGVAGVRTFIALENLSRQPGAPRLGAAPADKGEF